MSTTAQHNDQVERINLIQSSAKDFLAGEWSNTKVRALIETSHGFDPELWRKICDLGWPGLMLSEADGGSEGNFLELAAITEECGKAIAAAPLVPHAVTGQLVLQTVGSARPDLVEAAAQGQAPLTLAVLEQGICSDRTQVSLTARKTASGWSLNGAKYFVQAAREASFMVVAARLEDGSPALLAVPATTEGLTIERLKPLDWSALDIVHFADVNVDGNALLAQGDEAQALLKEALIQSDVLICAELCGVADTALNLAIDYAKERVAYGKPIGQFQAVKHRLVNMRADIEIAKALLRAATASIDAREDRRHVCAAQAAYWTLDTLKKVPEGCLQVFGGIGFTWEHDLHLYLRRAATLASLLGDRAEHREIIVDALEAPGTAAQLSGEAAVAEEG